MRFLKLDENRRIEQAVTFDTQSVEFSGEMRIVWTFEVVDVGTRVRIACENVPPGIESEDHEAGMASTLENLGAFTEEQPS